MSKTDVNQIGGRVKGCSDFVRRPDLQATRFRVVWGGTPCVVLYRQAWTLLPIFSAGHTESRMAAFAGVLKGRAGKLPVGDPLREPSRQQPRPTKKSGAHGVTHPGPLEQTRHRHRGRVSWIP